LVISLVWLLHCRRCLNCRACCPLKLEPLASCHCACSLFPLVRRLFSDGGGGHPARAAATTVDNVETPPSPPTSRVDKEAPSPALPLPSSATPAKLEVVPPPRAVLPVASVFVQQEPRTDRSGDDPKELNALGAVRPALADAIHACATLTVDSNRFENECEETFQALRRGLRALSQDGSAEKGLDLDDVPGKRQVCDFLLLMTRRRRMHQRQVDEVVALLEASGPWARVLHETGGLCSRRSKVLEPMGGWLRLWRSQRIGQ